MRILGVDPGLNVTGYGLVEHRAGHSRLLEAGVIKPKKKDPFEKRLGKIYSILKELIEQYQPDVLVLEKLYTHSVHPVTASILGHARGVICLLCEHKNLKLSEQGVKRLRKGLIGNGNASKMQIKHAVSQMLNIDQDRLTLDASDALALALGYVYLEKRLL